MNLAVRNYVHWMVSVHAFCKKDIGAYSGRNESLLRQEVQEVRGSEKHIHSKEGSTGHLYKCPCASASV